MGHFTPSLNGPFGSPRVVPMPQVDVVHAGPPGGLPNGLGVLAGPVLVEMPPMPPPAVADATAAPPPPGSMGMDSGAVPMDTCSMPGMQTQGEAQAQAQDQHCKFDLLSSLPCE